MHKYQIDQKIKIRNENRSIRSLMQAEKNVQEYAKAEINTPASFHRLHVTKQLFRANRMKKQMSKIPYAKEN